MRHLCLPRVYKGNIGYGRIDCDEVMVLGSFGRLCAQAFPSMSCKGSPAVSGQYYPRAAGTNLRQSSKPLTFPFLLSYLFTSHSLISRRHPDRELPYQSNLVRSTFGKPLLVSSCQSNAFCHTQPSVALG